MFHLSKVPFSCKTSIETAPSSSLCNDRFQVSVNIHSHYLDQVILREERGGGGAAGRGRMLIKRIE